MIVGESSDLIFGGMDQLLSKDWTVEAFQHFLVDESVPFEERLLLPEYGRHYICRDSAPFQVEQEVHPEFIFDEDGNAWIHDV